MFALLSAVSSVARWRQCTKYAVQRVCFTVLVLLLVCQPAEEKRGIMQIYIQIIYSFGFCLFASIPYDLTKIKTSVEKEGFHVQFMQIHVAVIFILRCKILAPVCPLTWNHKLIFSSQNHKETHQTRDELETSTPTTCHQFLTQFNTASRLTGTLICSNKKLNVKIFVISIVRVTIWRYYQHLYAHVYTKGDGNLLFSARSVI